jgi:hypothetical protein
VNGFGDVSAFEAVSKFAAVVISVFAMMPLISDGLIEPTIRIKVA